MSEVVLPFLRHASVFVVLEQRFDLLDIAHFGYIARKRLLLVVVCNHDEHVTVEWENVVRKQRFRDKRRHLYADELARKLGVQHYQNHALLKLRDLLVQLEVVVDPRRVRAPDRQVF